MRSYFFFTVLFFVGCGSRNDPSPEPKPDEEQASKDVSPKEDDTPKKKDEEPPKKKDEEPPKVEVADGMDIVRSLGIALLERYSSLGATSNAFKKEEIEAKYQNSLKSFRGKKVILRGKIGEVGKETVSVAELLETLDPDLQTKADANLQRELRGGKPPPIPVSLLWDFSGIDRGKHYERPEVVLFGKKDPIPVVGDFGYDKFDPALLRQLDKGDPVTIEGQIVSLATYSAPGIIYIDNPPSANQFLVTLKVRSVVARKRH